MRKESSLPLTFLVQQWLIKSQKQTLLFLLFHYPVDGQFVFGQFFAAKLILPCNAVMDLENKRACGLWQCVFRQAEKRVTLLNHKKIRQSVEIIYLRINVTCRISCNL
jgi:hypothetical protein